MTEKHPALGRRGMVVTNHPLASAAGSRNAGRRRQRDRRRNRRVLHPDRGRADDGRHPGRRHGAYPPRRRHPHDDRQPEHCTRRYRPDDLHARPQRRPRHDGHDRPQERRRPDRRRGARQSEGLVRGAAIVSAPSPAPTSWSRRSAMPRAASGSRPICTNAWRTAPPTWRAIRKSPGCICRTARRSSPARAW